MSLKGHLEVLTVSLRLNCLLLLAPFTLCAYAQAGFKDNVSVEGDQLELRGESSFSWLFFDLYDAALYLPEEANTSEGFDVLPKKLVLRYKREVPADKIVEAGTKLLKKNCSPDEFAAIEAQVEKINRAYITPQKGDTYALSFHPERGSTVLYFNNEELTSIEGADFADLYFRIWLGKHPVSERLRDELLKNST